MSYRSLRRGLTLLLLSGLVVFTATSIQGALLVVDDDGGTPYQTIQSAIDAAIPGVDAVFVRCGVYTENIDMRESVDVSGERAQCTVIDGGQNGSVVTIVDLVATVTLQGFTIRNGSSGRGGGIYIESSSPTITKNLITGNSAVITGAITGYGGGIHVTDTVDLRAAPAPLITGNIIRGNTAENFGGGIEFYLDGGSTVSNNIIAENSAGQAGGGIDAFASFPTIFNNSIVFNCLQGAGTACSGGGGGVSFDSSGDLDFSNNLVAWNEAGGGAGGVDLVGGSTVFFFSNDAFGNLGGNYAGVADPTGSDGNISIDPLLVDLNPRWLGLLPRSDSPLVDAATDLGLLVDVRGVPRPLDGDADGLGVTDIGARENEGVTRLMATGPDTFGWDLSLDPAAVFNLYRGDLQELKSTGVYTQEVGVVPGAWQWCGIGAPSQTDLDDPDPAQVLFYLATLDNISEGTLGFDGAAAERPFAVANQCP